LQLILEKSTFGCRRGIRELARFTDGLKVWHVRKHVCHLARAFSLRDLASALGSGKRVGDLNGKDIRGQQLVKSLLVAYLETPTFRDREWAWH
jgi:hypothetical protein